MISTNSHFRYAEALIKTSKRLGIDEQVLADLRGLNLCFMDSDFRLRIKDISYLRKEDGEKLLRGAFEGKVQPMVLNLLSLLSRSGKLSLLPRIYTLFAKYYFEGKGIDRVVIRTARKLTGAEESKLVEDLMQKSDKAVNVEFETDVKMIGGVQIFQKGFLTDLTVKNYLETLKKQLLT
jgi:F-type H+-transporting ATPase subunit delta